MPKPIYVLNGPNLNLLGSREPHIYGSTTLDQIGDRCATWGREAGYAVEFRQTNHEGELVDWIQEAARDGSAVVLNAGALTHTSVALHDVIKGVDIPVVECHISNPHARESFRHHSYVSLAASGVVMGFGADSYELALDGALRLLSRRSATAAANS